MRKWLILFGLAAAGFALVPDASEACGRRRCRFAACPPPCYIWQPCPPVVIGPGGAPPVAPGRTVTIKGKVYQILPTGDQGENDKEELEKTEPGLLKTANIPPEDAFAGTARRLAKTTIFAGEPKPFTSVSALRTSLPDNDAMKAMHIGKGANVNRVQEEKLNVVVNAYIYAFRKESDNDYHVIIGDEPGTPNPRYLNAEVSGIPVGGTDANRARLVAVRSAFKEAFGLESEGPNSYFRPHPPVPVRLAGSLFWDPEHEPPHTVGPGDFQPGTAWEIHPISSIEFTE